MSQSSMRFEDISERIAQEYALPLLNWAYRKLGDRSRAEDLSQEVLLQVFAAVKKACAEGTPVENEERFVWKIAHYVWCHYLRQKTHTDKFVLMEAPEAEDMSDFAREFADTQEREELTRALRQHIVRLDFLQREIMISFYIDRIPQQEIAERLGIAVSTVKWHLFDTRKKLRKELETMMEKGKEQDFVYRPKKLHLGISGQAVAQPDTEKLEESLTRQNICVACYREPKNLDELSGMLGVPKAYLEFDLKWLIEKEFIAEQAGRYVTTFLISTDEERFGYFEIYYKHRRELSDVVVNGLVKAEEKIRAIGFHGCDAPMEKLLWLLIYRFCNYFDWAMAKASRQAPIRPDGGRYFPLGFLREEEKRRTFDSVILPSRFVEDVCSWNQNGSMNNDNFHWFGLYDFGGSEIESMMDGFTPEWEHLHSILCTILHSDFDASWIQDDKRYMLAQLLEKGFVTLHGSKAVPDFAVFTASQYESLTKEVFEPIAQELRESYEKLREELEKYFAGRVPAQLQKYRELPVDHALNDFAWLTTLLAFEDGRLLVPESRKEREFLTMMYVIR